MSKETDDGATPGEALAPSLDDVLIALQKTFSRVSAESASVDADSALALITGAVTFELELSADLDGDYLVQRSDGAVRLSLRGTVQTDIRRIRGQDAEALPADDPSPRGGEHA